METNERLRAAITDAGMTSQALGDVLEVDPKTVDRWISTNRVPHRRHRQAAAAELGKEEHFLWPDAFSEGRSQAATAAELVAVHPNRGSVPPGTWEALIGGSVESIDLLAFAATFVHDTIPDIDDLLAERANSGTRIRLLFGDPDSAAVALRGVEEGIGDSLAARCKLTWRYFKPLLGLPGIEARAHESTLYTSIFRFDDELLANHHTYGAPANHSPVMHLHRIPGGRMFDHQIKGFERVWEAARPADVEWVA
jgi:hypothetical protein